MELAIECGESQACAQDFAPTLATENAVVYGTCFFFHFLDEWHEAYLLHPSEPLRLRDALCGKEGKLADGVIFGPDNLCNNLLEYARVLRVLQIQSLYSVYDLHELLTGFYIV